MNPGGFGRRAPLLWLLLPFMAGLAGGRLADLPPALPLGIASAAALVACYVSFRAGAAALRIWPLAIGTTMAMAGAAYYHLRLNRINEWNRLPPLEARLTLRVTQVFATSGAQDRANGLAVVAGAPRHLADLTGQVLFF